MTIAGALGGAVVGLCVGNAVLDRHASEPSIGYLFLREALFPLEVRLVVLPMYAAVGAFVGTMVIAFGNLAVMIRRRARDVHRVRDRLYRS